MQVRRYKGRPEGVSPHSFGPVKKAPCREVTPLPERMAMVAEMRAETAEVFTAVDVTKLMLRVAERDKITAALRDRAQALLLDQYLRKKGLA